MPTTDIVGYIATFLTVMSFLISNKIKIVRSVNLVSALIFVVYGLMKKYDFPILITNGAISIIQIYYLTKMYLNKKVSHE